MKTCNAILSVDPESGAEKPCPNAAVWTDGTFAWCHPCAQKGNDEAERAKLRLLSARRQWTCLSCGEVIEHRATDCPSCGGDTFIETTPSSLDQSNASERRGGALETGFVEPEKS